MFKFVTRQKQSIFSKTYTVQSDIFSFQSVMLTQKKKSKMGFDGIVLFES